MLEKKIFFEKLPHPDLNKEIYSVSSFNDDALNYAAIYLRAKRHSTTQEAVNNLIRDMGSRRVIGIDGHGAPGYVETGAGPRGGNENQYLSRGNQYAWSTNFEILFSKSFDKLVIYSCSTGAGRSGAYLLWLLAKHIEKQVIARTGLLYVVRQGNKIWFETEKGATWQVANHDMIEPPEHIDPPNQFMNYKNSKKAFEYFEGDNLVTIEFEKVTKIEVVVDNNEVSNLNKESYYSFLDSLFYTDGISIEGEILGVIQKQVSIYFEDKKMMLSIYEDRFCKIDEQPIGYFISKDFSNFFMK